MSIFRWVPPLLLVGCSTTMPTEIVVIVDSNLRVPEDLETITIRVFRDDDQLFSDEEDLDSSSDLPRTLSLRPAQMTDGPFSVEVIGDVGASTLHRVASNIVFVTNQRKALYMPLVGECFDVDCTETETCIAGACESSAVDSNGLPSFDGTAPASSFDGGPFEFPDAGIDTGVDAGPQLCEPEVDPDCRCDDTSDCLDAPCIAGRCVSDVVSHVIGFDHMCTLFSPSLPAACFGANESGELGDGSNDSSEEYVDVVGLDGVMSLTVGYSHTCAVTASGVSCWGRNNRGQIGDGTMSNRNTPYEAMPGAVRACAGFSHTCAAGATGLNCWGANSLGQLGTGEFQDHTTPVPVTMFDGLEVSQITCGGAFTCALVDGMVYCWGSNNRGQLGINSTDAFVANPTPVTGLPSEIFDIEAGQDHMCIHGSDGVWCWGNGDVGQLGNTLSGENYLERAPIHVPPITTGLTAVTLLLGNHHTCIIALEGSTSLRHLYCFGLNESSQVDPDDLTEPCSGPSRCVLEPTQTAMNISRAWADNYATCYGAAGGLVCIGDPAIE